MALEDGGGTPAPAGASAPAARTAMGRLSFLVEELRPRAKEVRHSLHLLRKSVLAMIGLGIVVFFILIAILGPALAPYPFRQHIDEKNGPPMARPLVTRTYPGLDVTSTGWNFTHPSYGPREILSRDDDIRARSPTLGDEIVIRRFQLNVYTDEIVSVQVGVQYNSSEFQPGNLLDVSVSPDGGTTWTTPVRSPLRFSDSDTSFYYLDFTSLASWTAAKLTDSNFAVRIVHGLDPAYAPGGVELDAVNVVVRFNGEYHVLGTTVDGEDVLSGILLGAQISIRIGLIVVIIGTLIGSILGALAGYFGGFVDELIMRITDVFLSIPGLILAMAVAAAIPPTEFLGLKFGGRNLDTVMFALIIVWWPPYTRLVRGQALSVRENTYIEAARASGASEMRVVGRHILPNTLSPILVQASLDVGSVVLVAAGLSFLGLGAQPGTPEWGLMVSKGFTYFPPAGNNWWQVGFAGLMIFLFVLGFNLIGDGVRDILDPRLRR